MSKKNQTRVYDIRKNLPKTPPVIPAASNPVMVTPTDVELEKPFVEPAPSIPEFSPMLVKLVSVEGKVLRVNPNAVAFLGKANMFGSAAEVTQVFLMGGQFLNVPGTPEAVEAQLFG